MVGVPGRIDGRYAAYGMRTTTPSRGAAAKTADSKPAPGGPGAIPPGRANGYPDAPGTGASAGMNPVGGSATPVTVCAPNCRRIP